MRRLAAKVSLFLPVIVFALLSSHTTDSHEPVTTKVRFNKEIVRIFRQHCVACHQPGGANNIFLHNYAAARPWAKAIKEEVLERRMPPFAAVKGFGHFENDYALTQHEIDQIVGWVDGGTPKGDDKDFPTDATAATLFGKHSLAPSFAPGLRSLKTITIRANEQMPARAEQHRVESSYTMPATVAAIAIRPLLFPFAKSLEVTARRPDGTREVLVWARDYRYDWQPVYEFKHAVTLPKGTHVKAVAYLDDSKPVRLPAPLCELTIAAVNSTAARAPVVVQQNDYVYVCPMHADVMSDEPGQCPKCGMTMTKAPRPETAEFDVRINTVPSVVKAGQKFRLTFDVQQPRSGVKVKKFNVVHDKPFHLFIVSQDLNYFAHEHPTQNASGDFTLDTSVPRPGAYLVYADIFPAGGLPQVAYASLLTANFAGDLFTSRVQIKPDEVLLKTIAGVRVSLNITSPVAGRNLTLSYKFTDEKTGAELRDLEPYLGAWGHTLILSEDGRDYVHSHPTEVLPDGVDRSQLRGGPEVSFAAFLPRAGHYRIWTQFQRQGKVMTVPFTIEVRPY